MLPLNYAIMKYVASVPYACAEDVIEALRPEYGKFKMLRMENVEESLMTAKANGLLEEHDWDADEDGNLNIFYRTTDYGSKLIKDFIG